jgi:hypothetical protein
MFDVGGSVRVWRALSVGAAVSHYTHEDPIGISAQVPHPFFFNQFRTAQGSSLGAPRTETVIGPSRRSPRRAFSSRTASRARVRVANGPSVCAAFGAASLPDQVSRPFGAT